LLLLLLRLLVGVVAPAPVLDQSCQRWAVSRDICSANARSNGT
jgi:hypothetical protein